MVGRQLGHERVQAWKPGRLDQPRPPFVGKGPELLGGVTRPSGTLGSDAWAPAELGADARPSSGSWFPSSAGVSTGESVPEGQWETSGDISVVTLAREGLLASARYTLSPLQCPAHSPTPPSSPQHRYPAPPTLSLFPQHHSPAPQYPVQPAMPPSGQTCQGCGGQEGLSPRASEKE